jgi:hypothetical protein
MHHVLTAELQAMLDADPAGVAILASQARVVEDDLLQRVHSAQACAAIQTAARSCRISRTPPERTHISSSSSLCVFSDTPATFSVDLFTNRPEQSRVSVLLSHDSWHHLLEAVAVVCNATEWVSQLVSAWLAKHGRDALEHSETQCSRRTLDLLSADAALLDACAALELAQQYVKSELFA